MVGLPNVDNTTDANKPISSLTQTALNTKAPINFPTFTGTVSGIDKTMVGLPNVDNTTDANKPISSLAQSALNTKAPINSPTFTGTVSGIDKTMVGLPNVDNTMDANKPISSLAQSALNAKAPINFPTFTGTVSGIDKTMVGLPNVDNTTDANKPISTATQTALDLKVSLPTTGNVTGNILYWNGTAWIGLTLGTPNQILSVSSGGTLNWSCIVTNTVVNPSTTPTLLESTALTPINIATTGATGIGTATGLPSGVTATWSADLITISGTPTVAGTFTYTILLTGGCGTVNATGSITVTAFNCGTATVLDGSGNSYNTVAIDNQCWTRENLRTRYYNDNITEIRFDKSGGVTGDKPWNTHTWSGSGLKYGAYTLYAHDSTGTPSNLSIYGYLYNWYAVAGIITNGGTSTKNICPVGWHVPSDADFTALTTYLGGESVAGGKMKSTGTAYWDSPNIDATNSSGFSALPGGYRDYDGRFVSLKGTASFWSASVDVSAFNPLILDPWKRDLGNYFNSVYRGQVDGKDNGFSVRCLKD
jgi:uncharacterized protein (TIGR02145 family)